MSSGDTAAGGAAGGGAGTASPRTVAVLQSAYLPWKGYFDLIHDVDLLVFYDDVQYTRQDWRNRNRIKTPHGLRWLTIPVGTSLARRICDVELPAGDWQSRHWQALRSAYGGAPHFGRYRELLAHLYCERRWETLSQLNQHLVGTIARELLGIRTQIVDSRDYAAAGRKQDRLLDLLDEVGASVYVSGPAGRRYLEPDRFTARGIELRWKSYEGYPEYPQLHGPFVHEVTVLDLLFQVGPAAPDLIWGWRGGA